MVQLTLKKAEVAQSRATGSQLRMGALALHPQPPLPSLLLPPGHVGNSFRLLPPRAELHPGTWRRKVQDHVTNPWTALVIKNVPAGQSCGGTCVSCHLCECRNLWVSGAGSHPLPHTNIGAGTWREA